MEFLDTEVGRAQRYERPFSLLIFDIDKFKSINDKYSHLGGDYVLRELSLQVRPTIRKGDLFARYGGEEFAICLVETGLEQAIEVAERLRVLVADHPFEFGDRQLRVTISIGVASMTDLDSANPTSLVEKADSRLYRAKELGRNRVVASSHATVPC
jgi:diguanylate cyclase (GGDEF)-like protein